MENSSTGEIRSRRERARQVVICSDMLSDAPGSEVTRPAARGTLHAARSAMDNPTNFRDETVCPICARPFKRGEAVIRWRRYAVHVECLDEADESEHPAA